MFGWTQTQDRELTVEQARKVTHILVIDDQEWGFKDTFERDGYHIERWATIKNMSQLTDGHYHVILLDIHGVGLEESPDEQGLGILEHIKNANPAQAVIAYSARKHAASASTVLARADAVMDKRANYLEYKTQIDRLLVSRAQASHYVESMNHQLGPYAARVPKAVPKAIRALRTGRTGSLQKYLERNVGDAETIQLVLSVISIGVTTLAAVKS